MSKIVWMLKGKIEFRLGTQQRVCGRANVVLFREVRNTRHGSAKTRGDRFLRPPPRDDFLVGGKPAYMSES